MPEVSLSADTAATRAEAWAFIEDMDNWAPFLTGYQSHRKIDERHSLWTVKGELGGLTRIAELRVRITQWVEPDHIAFELEGIDEPFAGSGVFRFSGTSQEAAPPPPAPSRWARLRNAFARLLLGRLFGHATATVPVAASGAPATRLECTLALNAGGGSGPILNLLLAPMLPVIARDMAGRITAELAERHGIGKAHA